MAGAQSHGSLNSSELPANAVAASSRTLSRIQFRIRMAQNIIESNGMILIGFAVSPLRRQRATALLVRGFQFFAESDWVRHGVFQLVGIELVFPAADDNRCD